MWHKERLKRGRISLLIRKNSAGIIKTVLCLMLMFFLAEQVPEEDVFGSSGTSFIPAGYASPEIKVCYFLGGGIQNPHNKGTYPADGKHALYEPYRYGYRFLGWYKDRSFRQKIKSVSYQESRKYLLYARWTPKIDNRANVRNYPYQEKGSLDKSIKILKNLDYDFLDEVDIPGMPETREDDFINKYIYSEAQCPQGMCLTEEFVLITSYSAEDGCMGEMMVFDRESGDYLVTLGMDEDSHLGGITFDGENVWVCNSYEQTIERISYDFIQLMAYQNTGGVVDARNVVDEYEVDNTPSCITWYGERLWVASHQVVMNSKVYAYHFNTSENSLETLSSFNIPPKVQGMAFNEDGGIYLSCSYGRNKSSYLFYYTSVSDMATRPRSPDVKVELPPCSEEIDISPDSLYVLFESAGEKYYEGTDGKGVSLSPLDKLLVIPLEEINGT